MKTKHSYSRLLNFTFCFLIFYCANPLFAQDKVNLYIGMGLPELINGSVRFQYKKAQLGFSAGVMPAKDERVTAFGGAGFMHFGGHSVFSDRPPWYARFGLDFLRDENEVSIDKFLYLNLRVGKEIYFSKKVGMDVDFGVMFQLSHTRIGPDPWLDFEFPILPSLGVGIFYKL